jgi:2-polyprenyl-6-methoxyphenol hydroxylase-like FAD-dependent oxidoreductase
VRVAIVGGGAAGLLAALLLRRAGHGVLLFEQDDLHVAADAEVAAREAYRRAAPQLVQPHIVMSRCRLVLAEHLPDVLEALLDAGGIEVPLSARLPPGLADVGPQPGDEQLQTIMTRRSTFDWVLRRAVWAEPGITLQSVRVVGLCARQGSPPHVTGVRTEHGEVLVDVVVDATGRRSPVDRWLEELGAQPAEKWSADCGVTYFGRHYRIAADTPLPGPATTRLVVGFDEFTAVLFCSDNGAVQTAVVPLTIDRRFRHMAQAEVYDAVLRVVPTHAPWMRVLEPISPVHQMVAPHNTLRRLVVGGAPVVTGLLPVGDAVCTTNPTFGRGLSLAAWGAADLVEALGDHAEDPISQVLMLDARIAEHIVPYYHDQAKVDAARLAMLRCAVLDAPAPAASGGGEAIGFPALRAAAAVDPVAFRAFWALMGMLRRPDEIYRDPGVAAAAEEILKHGPAPGAPTPDAALLAAALNG